MFKKIIDKLLNDKKLLADVILVSAVLVIAFSALLINTLIKNKQVVEVPKTDEEGNVVTDENGDVIMVNPNIVVVSVDGKKVAEYPLSVDAVYTVEGYNGGTNVIVIDNGYVFVGEATCPGYQDCVEEGRKNRPGEMITCLPNRVIVEIVGDSDGGFLQ